MEPPLVLPVVAPVLSPGRQYATLVRRVRSFGIPLKALRACRTMGELKPLVRTAYLRKARQFHPDMRAGRQYHTTCLGTMFQRYTRTYQALMRLPDTLVFRHPDPTLPDDPLPWALERREVRLPWGYNESTEWLWWR